MSGQQQYGSHGAHAPGGVADGQSSASFSGADKHGHTLLSQVLGLDRGAHPLPPASPHMPGNFQGQALQAPSGSANWARALSAVKLSDVFQGVRLTPNTLFIMLYASFVVWLFVVYWIRHHEPLANSVLGTAAPGSATAAADRRIIAGTKLAFPARTSAETGDIYVPAGESSVSFTAGQENQGMMALPSSIPLPPPPVPPAPLPEPQPMPLSKQPGFFPQSQSYAATFGQPGAFIVREAQLQGDRVKMIVNR